MVKSEIKVNKYVICLKFSKMYSEEFWKKIKTTKIWNYEIIVIEKPRTKLNIVNQGIQRK